MIFLVIVPCVLCFVYAWRRRQKYLEGKLPPMVEGTWPVVGHLNLWLRGLFWERFLNMQKDTLKKACITYLYSGTNQSYTYYALCDPEDCRKVAEISDQKVFFLNEHMKSIFGQGLATSPVSVWNNHRQSLGPIFEDLCCLKDSNQQARVLVDGIQDRTRKGPCDQTDFIRVSIIRILFAIIFGVNEENTPTFTNKIDSFKSSIEKLSLIIFERYQSFFLHKNLFFRWSRLKRRQDECINVIRNVTHEIVTEKRDEYIKTNAGEGVSENFHASSNLLDHLLQQESQHSYSEQQVIDELMTMTFFGYETVANSLTFALVMLGSHLEVQDKVYVEVENVMDKSKRDIDASELTKLVYLEAVIMEALRLYPPVTAIARAVEGTTDIKRYALDPGAKCLLLIYAMNRHPCWGEDRESFRPERWLEGPMPEQGCFSFGMGRRSCIGKNIALTMMKVILAHIVREYKIISDATKLVVSQKLLLTPESGHHISLERRIPENKVQCL